LELLLEKHRSRVSKRRELPQKVIEVDSPLPVFPPCEASGEIDVDEVQAIALRDGR
jgi:hypothetical protein